MGKKILIKGYYGVKNLGDDYILYAILDTLKNIKNLDIYVYSLEDDYQELLDLFPNMRIHVIYKHTFNGIKATLDFIKTIDYYIIGGGGLFPKEDKKVFRSLAIKVMILKLITFNTIKISFYGIDINSISMKINRLYWRLISLTCSFIAVRNEHSFKVLKECKVKNCYLFSDVTFGFNTKIEEENEMHLLNKLNITKNQYIIFALAMPWHQKDFEKQHFRDRYEKFVGDIINLCRKYEMSGYKYIFVPFYDKTDVILINDIVSQLRRDCIICDGVNELSLPEKRYLFKYAKASISMRFHGIAFSLFHGTPVASISYSQKSTSLLDKAGLEKYYVEFGIEKTSSFYKEFDLNYDQFIKIVGEVLLAENKNDFINASKKLKTQANRGRDFILRWISWCLVSSKKVKLLIQMRVEMIKAK